MTRPATTLIAGRAAYAGTAKAHGYHPTSVFLVAIAAYAILQSAATVLGSGVLKALSYGVAISIFMIMLLVCAFQPQQRARFADLWLAAALYYIGVTCSLVVNHGALEYGDLLKMLLAPAFLLFGAAAEGNRSAWLWNDPWARLCFGVLAVLPVLVWLVQVVTGAGAGGEELSLLGAGREFSIFTNRNNAALYAVALLALYNVLAGRPVKNLLVILTVAAIFGTLGVLAAVIVALCISVARLRAALYALPVFIAVAALYLAVPELVIFKRITPVLDSFLLLVDGRIHLASVTYGELVVRLQTTDLSFLFRLKHWWNLLQIFADGSIYQQLFGFGIGSPALLSDIRLVPHNDYLRYLFECGVLGLLGFAALMALIVYHCGRRWEAVPVLAIVFYFFSENLINNYLAMVTFYFCAGALTTRLRSEHVTPTT
jgi:O-antigen ligase